MIDFNILHKLFRAILLPEKNGIPVSKFARYFAEMEGQEIPYKQLGYSTLIDLLKSMDSIELQTRNGEMRVIGRSTDDNEHVAKLVKEQNYRHSKSKRSDSLQFKNTRMSRFESNRPSHFQSKFSPRLQQNQYSMWNAQRPSTAKFQNNRIKTEYRAPNKQYNGAKFESSKMFSNDPVELKKNSEKINIEIKKKDVATSTETKFESQPESINKTAIKLNESECTECTECTEIMECTIRNESQTIIEDNFEDNSVIHGIDDFTILYNDDCNILDDLPEMSMKTFAVGNTMQVQIPQVHNPYKFWFHLVTYTDALTNLMDNLRLFYDVEIINPIAQQILLANNIKVGKIYAALYAGEWHRGKVVKIFNETVKVFYVDYGTVSEIPIKNLRYLHNDFKTYAAFAYRGCLDKIQPNKGLWSLESLQFFDYVMKEYQYTSTITAKITAINEKEKIFYLELVDQNKVPDYNIAEYLIISNYADNTKTLLSKYAQRHYNELYPSFDLLENGGYASIEEIIQYSLNGFNYLKYDESLLKKETLGYVTREHDFE